MRQLGNGSSGMFSSCDDAFKLTTRYALPSKVGGNIPAPPQPGFPSHPPAPTRTRLVPRGTQPQIPRRPAPANPSSIPPVPAATTRKRQTNTRETRGNGTTNGSSSRNNEPIDLASDSEAEAEVDQSIEILGEAPASRTTRNVAGDDSRRARQAPPSKRARQASEDSDDIILVED